MTQGSHVKFDRRRMRAEMFASQIILTIGDLIENQSEVRARLIEKAYDANAEIVCVDGERTKP